MRLLGEDLRYVSRGGLKLEKALEHWRVDLQGKTCLDVGASTGGFSDCMLQHGAAKVIAVDTGYGQMDFRLRNDPRMRLLEKKNARYLEPERPRRTGRFHRHGCFFYFRHAGTASGDSGCLNPGFHGLARLWSW